MKLTKAKFKSASVTITNYEDVMAIATKLADETGMTVSFNSALSVLIKRYKEEQ